MADRPPSNDTDAEPERSSRTPTPRWVKMFALAVGVLVLLAVLVMVLGGGNHGPARHQSGGPAGNSQAPVVAAAAAPHGLLGALG